MEEIRIRVKLTEHQLAKWKRLKEFFDTDNNAKAFKKYLDKGDVRLE